MVGVIKKFLKGFLFGIAYLPVIMFLFGIVLYIFETDFGREVGSSGFELATISAVIGGLILASGFLEKASNQLQFSLRRIGVLYLIATIFFIVYEISFPLIDNPLIDNPIAIWVVGISIASGALAFARATVLLVLVLRELWSYPGRPTS